MVAPFVASAVPADSTAVGTPHATETHIVDAGIIDSGYGMNRLFRRERGDGPSRTGGKATPKAFASGRRGYQSNKLLWGEGINNFFEAPVAAERVPVGHAKHHKVRRMSKVRIRNSESFRERAMN
ncbi:MAG: hypothetical protein DMF03_13210 [Verrucomicrobia bacterium]|nr:MAG: hypothetical protein DMF03_13210 [Verrucomicrobiota bacterium]